MNSLPWCLAWKQAQNKIPNLGLLKVKQGWPRETGRRNVNNSKMLPSYNFHVPNLFQTACNILEIGKLYRVSQLDIINILSQIILCEVGCSLVYWRMISSIHDLYALDASSNPPPVVTTKSVPRHCQLFPWGEMPPVEKHCCRAFGPFFLFFWCLFGFLLDHPLLFFIIDAVKVANSQTSSELILSLYGMGAQGHSIRDYIPSFLCR